MKSKLLFTTLLGIIILCCVGISIYSNTFQAPFRFDDEHNIVDNYSIRDLSRIRAIWDFWPTRFVTYLSFALNYHFNQLNVFGFHLVNLLIHLAAALLVYWLVFMTFYTPALEKTRIAAKQARLLSLLAGLVFVAHPIQTQAVTYIVQRTTALATLFYLAALGCYIKSRLLFMEKRPLGTWKLYYAISLVSTILAMFTKEITFTLPLIITLYEFLFFKTKKISERKSLLPYLFMLLIIPAIMLGTGSVNFQELHRTTEQPLLASPMHYLFTQFRVMVTYLRLLFIPLHQNLDYDYRIANSLFSLPVALSFLLLLSILWLSFKLSGRYKLIAFAIFYFFITLLPESSIIPIEDVIFEHRLYLPMAGYVFFLVSLIYYFGRKKFSLSVMVLLLLILGYSVLTFRRNLVWKDEFSLWSDTMRKSPQKSRSYVNRGLAYAARGDYEKAVLDFNQAIKLNSNLALTYHNLGLVYHAKQDYAQALVNYEKAIEIEPDNLPETYNNLGAIYFVKGNYDEAIANYAKAIERNPDYAQAYYNRALVYDAKGNHEQALADFNLAIKINPDYADAYTKRGIALANKGQPEQAMVDFNKIIKVNLNSAEAYNNRGIIYYKKGDSQKAIADFNQAMKIRPNYAEAYSNRGLVFAAKGNAQQAMSDYNQALKLNPNYPEAYYNRGIAYYTSGELDLALADFNQAISLSPKSDIYNNRGAIYYAKGNLDLALADFNQAIKLDPDSYKAYNNRGIIYYARGDYGRAISDYNQALKLNPDYADALHNREAALKKSGPGKE